MQGLILLDKPEGMTSFAAVARVRRICGEKRAGHTGTLDPMASGVLPVLLGRATRLSGLMLDADKRYTAVLQLGVVTDTLDTTGTILSRAPVEASPGEIEAACARFRGEILQTPPMYSALKRDGVRLYELARRGEAVAREARPVTIRQLHITGFPAADRVEIDVLCSKGTYIRSLADDIGRALGCGAALCALRRTMTAGFSAEDCVRLEQLETDGYAAHLLPADRAVAHLAAVTVSPAQDARFCHGGALALDRLPGLPAGPADDALLRVYGPGSRFLGLGRVRRDTAELAVVCVLADAAP